MVQVNLNISREVMENIFVTALEGGSNYWFSVCETDKEKIRTSTDPSDSFSVRLFKFIFDNRRLLVVCDAVSGKQLDFLHYSYAHKRIQDLLNSEYRWALISEVEGNGDATSSDIVFQYLCLGEFIYC